MRIACCVPFCRRTFKEEPHVDEMICGKHYRLASKILRRRRTRLVTRYRKKFGDNAPWAYPGGSPQRIEAVRLAKLCDVLWKKCKAQAIERAAGI